MKNHDTPFDPQHQKPTAPLVDEVAQSKQRAEEKEIAGRHKNKLKKPLRQNSERSKN